jgi:hypothetical protein
MFGLDDKINIWKELWVRGVSQTWFALVSMLSLSSKQDLELSTLPLTQ